jgi:NADPH-dependent glutamate synthase beta subunit-like oxidoreductase/Fe-S-cluster-containing hydrogenase component 2
MRVYQWETGVFPNVKLHLLPIMCYHCQDPACMEACDNKAIYKEDKYGAVLVDPTRCRGERKCWAACPYGSPQFPGDEAGLKMIKCTMCIDRLEEGLKPICVLSCSMRALEFGPMEEILTKYGNPNRLEAKPGYGPCRLACPAEINAQGYMALLAEGKFREAIELFRETTPFAGTLGRICTHPCEIDCQRGKIDQPVSVRALKRYMADIELKEGRKKALPIPATRKERVAIIGSGPAGLSCAYDLVRMGYPVTVFETAPKSGGMLRYCIPEYRLPKDILDNEISYIEELGVEIKTGSQRKSLREIFSEGWQAVFVATGAWTSRKLGVSGEEAEGVLYALDFLKKANSDERTALGKNVVVVGGGSVAIDSARTALRLGAERVCLVCLESRDLTCRDRMLAEELEIEEAEEEGVKIHSCLGVRQIVAENGWVSSLETICCTSVLDDRGSFAPQFCEGNSPAFRADTVIVAIGQKVDSGSLSELEKSASGNILADEVTLETSIRGVFAGSDAVTGPANVVRSIAQGKRGGESIHRYLRGMDLREGRRPPAADPSLGRGERSVPLPNIPLADRKGFREVALGLDDNRAKEQADRCLHCGSTLPSVVFRAVEPRRMVIPWDPWRALELWQKRNAENGESLPDVFERPSDIFEAPADIVGRNRLVLKPLNSEELLAYTTDDE